MMRSRALKLMILCLISLTLVSDQLPAAGHRIQAGRRAGQRTNYSKGYRGNNYPNRWPGWQRNSLRWPSYYAYYRYPIAGSIYYYSFPTNSNFYYSYPSYSTNWTYPSYPYVGKYYQNNAPVYANRLRSYRYSPKTYYPSSRTRLRDYPEGSTSVFISD